MISPTAAMRFMAHTHSGTTEIGRARQSRRPEEIFLVVEDEERVR
jgi:hypothetical protein